MDDGDSDAETSEGSERPTAIERPLRDADVERTTVELITHDRYRIVEQLGRGGMGEVMVARDEQVGRDVALKRLRKASPSERTIQRFLREARIQGRLEHPAIVPVHEIGRGPDGLPFFVMKKLSGVTLAKKIPTADLRLLLRAFVDVCLAIEFAHVRGVIHRDLKPDNIVLGDYGEVYVLDWGVAKVIGEPDGEMEDIGSGRDSSEDATIEGTVIGTPGYMPPEQARGETDVDARADVYSLGCLLFAILTGTELHPPGREGLASVLRGVDPRPSVRAPERKIPPELDAICVHALAPDRRDRTASARALGDRVQAFLDGDRDLATRQQLAQAHLERGRTAYAREDRSDAMREAGSALALDPAMREAAQLLAALMLEPPRTTPPEVDAALDIDETEAARNNARDGTMVYFAILAFAPVIWWISPAWWVAPLFAVPVLASLWLCWRGTVDTHHGSRLGVLALINAAMMAIVARAFGPLFIAPGFAAVAAMTIIFTPTKSRIATPLGLAIMMELAVLGPWLLELTGAIGRTTTVDATGLHIGAAAIGTTEAGTLFAATMYVFTLVALACMIAGIRRRHERDTKRQLLVQAWQLRQLLPR